MLIAKKLMILGACLLTFHLLMKFFLFDALLKLGLQYQTALRIPNEVRQIYLKLPFPLDFKVYFFNVTNPMEIQNGATPILNEIGPYCYDEYKEKIDVIDNDVEDSLEYSSYDEFKFNEEKSGNLKEDDYVTILHPFIVAMVNKVTKESPALLSIVNKAIMEIFQNPQSMYLTAKVRDVLFNGIEINCKVKEFSAKAVCAQLKQERGLKNGSESNVYLFSLLGPRNATIGKRLKVGRGIHNPKDLGKVLEIEGEKELNLWSSKECNRFHGTDGWIFPPFLTEEEGIWSFSSDLCRNVAAKFVKNVEYKGLNVRKYEATLVDMEHNEEDKCYCASSDTCLKKGVFDLSKCMGVPIYATLPHFLETDEMYLQQVVGMTPLSEKHGIRIHFEPMTGTPLEAKKRLQFNLPIKPNPKITLMEKIPVALHPIFWIEEGVELEGDLFNKIANVFLVQEVIGILLWCGIIICILITAFGAYKYHTNRKEVKITPVHSLKKSDLYSNESSDLNILNKKSLSRNEDNKTGYVNHVMSGHEFDKY